MEGGTREAALEAGDDVKASRPWRKLLGVVVLLAAVLFPALISLALRETSYRGGETTNDTYYHIAMADLGPKVFLARTFPYLTISSWTDDFADKELGYHVCLWLLRQFERLAGLDTGQPFRLAALLSCFMLFGGMVLAGVRMRIPPPALLLATCGSVCLSTHSSSAPP
jgi:hypothetical protein